MSDQYVKRKLAAILSADVEGYSRLMGEDEASTIHTLKRYKAAITKLVANYRGRVVDAPGDNLLAEFVSVVDAVQCAVEIQREIAGCNEEPSQECKMNFRIGVNLGDVVEEDDRIYGDGVNIAARLESLCEGGGVCISGTAFEHVENKLKLEFEDLGEHEVKNIVKPVHVYRVLSFPGAAAHRVLEAKRSTQRKWRIATLAIAAVLIAALGTTGIWHYFMRSSQPLSDQDSQEKTAHLLSDKPSIAVLPFNNLSDDPKQEYFADGMTDELITDLSKISGLLIISRNSSFTYKGKSVNVQQVADELNVKYVLEGSVQRAGDRVRVGAQLIDGTTDHHLWAESYDAVMENIFDLQDEITKKIAAALAVTLTAGEQKRFADKETTNIEAYDAFVKGWEYLHRNTADDLNQAVSFFKDAIKLDPIYSRAHAALAWAYVRSSLRFEWQIINRVPQEVTLMARKHLEIAMLNPTSTAHLVASKMALQRRLYEQSIKDAHLALTFDANDPDANLNMASVLISTGEPEKGLEFVNKTMRLDPRNIDGPLFEAGKAYFSLGDLQKAALMTERAIEQNPTFYGRYEQLAAIYGLLDRQQDAQAAYEKSLKAWRLAFVVPDVTNIMVLAVIKDRQVADRYADGLAKAGYLGKPSDYYKIQKENRLPGEEIRKLVSGNVITIYEYRKTKWVNHSENGKLLYAGKGGNWWIESDMLCYRMEKGRGKRLNDCGEVYRNPDASPGSDKQYLHVKDWNITALTTEK